MKVAWIIAPFFIGAALANIRGDHKIIAIIDGKPLPDEKHLILSPGQSFSLKCTFICLDDDPSKCRYLNWRRYTRDSGPGDVISTKFRNSNTLDGRQSLVSNVTFIASMKTYGIYTCTVANSWEARIMVDLVTVTADGNVTLPTLLKDQKVSKVPFERRVINQTNSMVLQCTIKTTAPTDLRVHYWKFKGETLKNGDDYAIRSEITADDSRLSLVLKNPGITSIGPYECGLNVKVGSTTRAIVSVNSPPIINMQKEDVSLRQKQGDPFRLQCRASVYPLDDVTFEWYKDNLDTRLEISSGVKVEEKINTKNSTIDSTLIFDKLEMENRGLYFCKVKSALGEDVMGWYLRVLDPLAPVWPLIGIILEVLVVVIIIVVYEFNMRKRRRAKKLAEVEHAANLATFGETTTEEKENELALIKERRATMEHSGAETRQRTARA